MCAKQPVFTEEHGILRDEEHKSTRKGTVVVRLELKKYD